MNQAALLRAIEETDETTIWGWAQNHPELIVRDLEVLLDLREDEVKAVRKILMLRGVNKWLWARRRFIALKHRVKSLVREFNHAEKMYGSARSIWLEVCHIYEEMQHIAHSPRWVEWGTHVHRKMRENDKDVVVRGRSN